MPKQAHKKKPKFYLYTKINENQTKTLRKLITNSQTRQHLAQIFGLQTHTNTSGSNVSIASGKINDLILDFHFNNLHFCKTEDFTNERMSTLLALLDHVLHHSLQNKLSDEESFKMFKQILLRHSIQRPPMSMAIFTLENVKAITDYVLKSFYRHYSFYEFIFRPRVELSLQSALLIETSLPCPESLEGGVQINPKELDELKEYLPVVEEQQKGVVDAKKEEKQDEGEESDQQKLDAIFRKQIEKIQMKMDKKVEEMEANINTKIAQKK